MNIVIMRHGQAESQAATDFDRPLTMAGLKQASSAGSCLSGLGLSFDQVWVSPYLRTQQTADQVLAQLSVGKRLSVDLLVPETRPLDLITALGEQSCDNLLLVSHQPLVSSLVSSLAGIHVPMSPASMALLETAVVAADCAELKWLRHAPDFERE
jgi:phosphohistidine phosphatase